MATKKTKKQPEEVKKGAGLRSLPTPDTFEPATRKEAFLYQFIDVFSGVQPYLEPATREEELYMMIAESLYTMIDG